MRTRLNSVHSLEDAADMNFEVKKIRSGGGGGRFSGNANGERDGGRGYGGGNYASRAPARPEPNGVIEILLNLSEISRDQISNLYSLGRAEHVSGATRNDKRLVVKIQNASTNEIFIYNTEFIVGDDFKGKAMEFLAS